MKDRSLC